MHPMYVPNQANQLYSYPYGYPNRSFKSSTRMQDYTVSVVGKSEVLARPDQARVSFGVVTEDKQVQTAQQQNAILANQVIDALAAIGIANDQIETAAYTIQPMYDYPDNQKVFRGYQVSHLFTVVVNDLTKVGEVLDVATQNGANVINEVEYELANSTVIYQEALQDATLNARKKAENMAHSLGLSINRIPLRLTEENVQLQRPRYTAEVLSATTDAVTTPVQEGHVKVTATVQAVFEYERFE
ncbi:26 kDa periplasmic immunogenic protein precursor [Paraliobacillus sp. PM-2]|uniref:SIMPL domain-containing protein n=1 Tax=Paraliobacillus sp. PM-2 TaxID=1462524 RepID=UPI00061C9ED1|nr:SIMPL domain-containing protein [Paraliobacillus sp. PM-2]CQR47182.1 26 kDa periplasmic immunogenic protein precursor [Paraliobacillus sp. PM-2]